MLQLLSPLIMVGSLLAAIITAPVCAVFIVIFSLREKRTPQWCYVACLSVPLFFFCVSSLAQRVFNPPAVVRCNEGNVRNCSALGKKALAEGAVEDARRYFKYSCQMNDYEACYDLLQIEKKHGNEREAKTLFLVACNGAGPNWYCDGLKIPEEELEIIQETLCLQKKLWACHNLGNSEQRKGHFQKARKLFKVDCDAGDTYSFHSCERLADLEYKMGNLAEFGRLYQSLCHNKDSNWCKDKDMQIRELLLPP